MKIWMMIIFLYYIGCIVDFIFIKIRRGLHQALCRLTINLFCPIIGLLFFWIVELIMKFTRDNEIDYSSLMENEDVQRQFLHEIDVEKEINVMAIEDVLHVGNNTVKRKEVLQLLKENADKYMDYLMMALKDPDSETSHYAASGIMEVKKQLELTQQELAVMYENDRSDVKTCISYAEFLKKYISTDLLESRIKLKNQYTYVQVLKQILVNEDNVDEIHLYYDSLIRALIALKEYEQTEQWCKRFMNKDSDTEWPYVSYLYYYYKTNQKRLFRQMMDQLMTKELVVSRKTMELIRFWSGGE